MSFDENNHIQDRPKELFKIEYYTKIPNIAPEFAYASLPKFLHVDLAEFFGIMPITKDLLGFQSTFHIQPSQSEIEYYKEKETSFQIINVVANIHTFKSKDDKVIGYPYSISLIPAQYRGQPDSCSIEYIDSMELGKPSEHNFVYSNFSPFRENDRGLYMDLSWLIHPDTEIHTDTIGFIFEKYYLRTDIDLNDILILGPHDFVPLVIQKYNKYRIKRYFKPFTDVRPRKIWGCDSPIELFLIQALAQENLFPVIQTLIFRNGHVYDNFYEMIRNKIFIKGDQLITEVDLFFPEIKLAIFCDSIKYHRGNKAKNKDLEIDKALTNIGIKTIRFSGKEIIENLAECVAKIQLYHQR